MASNSAGIADLADAARPHLGQAAGPKRHDGAQRRADAQFDDEREHRARQSIVNHVIYMTCFT